MLMTFLMLSVILTSNFCQHLELTLQTGAEKGMLISMLEKLHLFRLTDIINPALLMWKWMFLFLKKNHPWRCWDPLFLLNSIETLTLPLAKATSEKTGTLICSFQFISPEVAFYIYKEPLVNQLGNEKCHCNVLGLRGFCLWRFKICNFTSIFS